jgi:hypothetical protein
MASMIIHDARLLGVTPSDYDFVFEVDDMTAIDTILRVVANFGRNYELDDLHILCHGFEANWDVGGQMCMPQAHGGFGLQLGRDNLTLFNASKTAVWKDLIGNIVLFACAPADTGDGNRGTYGDGKRFCGELALWTNATVIAARDTQYYDHAEDGEEIDFGDWEGPVYQFTSDQPDGTTLIDPSGYALQR